MVFENKTKVTPVASHLHILFGRKNWHALWQTYTLVKNWHTVAGKKIAARSEPAYIQKNTLWIHVRDSVWMQHMQSMKPQLIEKVRQFMPEMDINDIRWIIQPVIQHTENRQVDKRKEPHPPDPGMEKAFTRMSSTVENDECRTALHKLWHTYHKYQ